jgi:DNA-binding PadR family transcriptional regulator
LIVITAKTAVLMSLREGPSYGRELVRRIGRATDGRLRLSEGTVRPALRALSASGLVTAWNVVPGRARGGRARTYYELTIEGVRQSDGLAATLLKLAGGDRNAANPSSPAAREAMRLRAERVAELFDVIRVLRGARVGARRRA